MAPRKPGSSNPRKAAGGQSSVDTWEHAKPEGKWKEVSAEFEALKCTRERKENHVDQERQGECEKRSWPENNAWKCSYRWKEIRKAWRLHNTKVLRRSKVCAALFGNMSTRSTEIGVARRQWWQNFCPFLSFLVLSCPFLSFLLLSSPFLLLSSPFLSFPLLSSPFFSFFSFSPAFSFSLLLSPSLSSLLSSPLLSSTLFCCDSHFFVFSFFLLLDVCLKMCFWAFDCFVSVFLVFFCSCNFFALCVSICFHVSCVAIISLFALHSLFSHSSSVSPFKHVLLFVKFCVRCCVSDFYHILFLLCLFLPLFVTCLHYFWPCAVFRVYLLKNMFCDVLLCSALFRLDVLPIGCFFF